MKQILLKTKELMEKGDFNIELFGKKIDLIILMYLFVGILFIATKTGIEYLEHETINSSYYIIPLITIAMTMELARKLYKNYESYAIQAMFLSMITNIIFLIYSWQFITKLKYLI